jgi:cell division protein FtsN
MMTSSTYRSTAARLLLALLLLSLFGCAALNSGKKSPDDLSLSDSTSRKTLLIDPWSLGPDVFGTENSSDSSSLIVESISEDTIVADSSFQTEVVDSSSQITELPSTPAEEEKIEVPVAANEPDVGFQAAPDLPDTVYTVQLGTFLDKERAQSFYDRASEVLGLAGTIFGDWPFYKLQFGAYPTRASADSLHRVAMSRGFYDARVLKLPSR